MIWTSLVLSAVLCQGALPQGIPQAPQDPSAPAGYDVVILKGGERLEGAVLVASADYVEIRLDSGTVVGFARDRVESIKKAVVAVSADATQGQVRIVEDQWFVVHDGEGVAVGWVHSHARQLGDERTEFNEEWEFTQNKLRTAVTVQEVLDGQNIPLSCYYRERTFVGADERVRSERIVEARLTDDTLHVTRLTGADRDSRSYRMPPDATFPLAARWSMRQGSLQDRAQDRIAVVVFDPGEEQFKVQSFRPARPRLVAIDGEDHEILEVLVESGSVRNSEWLDGTLNVVRREINGSSLVAMPASAEGAQQLADMGSTVSDANFVLETNGLFGVWSPNPAWVFADDDGEGRLTLNCPTMDAQVRLLHLPEASSLPTVDAAADTVERWHALLHPEFKLESRRPATVRGRRSIVLEGTTRKGLSVRNGGAYIIPLGDSTLVLTWSCPAEQERALTDDFNRILTTIDLDPKAPKAASPKEG